MAARKHRLVVGSLGSVLVPAMTVLIPVGITFSAARLYAESSVLIDCDSGVFTACADAGSVNYSCTGCGTASCACVPNTQGCLAASGTETRASFCSPVQSCDNAPAPGDCAGKTVDAGCTLNGQQGVCTEATALCLPSDGGVATSVTAIFCGPPPASTSSSTGGYSSSGEVGAFPVGDTVPGSSSSSSGDAAKEDEGCSTTPSNTTRLPLLAAPLAIGLLLALRKRKKR